MFHGYHRDLLGNPPFIVKDASPKAVYRASSELWTGIDEMDGVDMEALQLVSGE
jgi:hypothetical protein